MKNTKKATPNGHEQPQKKGREAPAAQLPSHLLLVLYASKLAAWQAAPGKEARILLIKGEEQLDIRDAATLESAYADLSERLRGDGIAIHCTHWLTDALGRRLLTQRPSLVDNGSPGLQLLAWEWISHRFGLGDVPPWQATETLTHQILPWLVTADDAAHRQHLQRLRENEHLSETERLGNERIVLSQENEHLRIQNAALQQVDAERLVSFLPALFPSVFTILGASDLSLLCGRVEPLPIPNPYPEPSEETLRTLQRRFRTLPQELQGQIVRFVSQLPQRQKLKPRPEMRDLVHTLEEQPT